MCRTYFAVVPGLMLFYESSSWHFIYHLSVLLGGHAAKLQKICISVGFIQTVKKTKMTNFNSLQTLIL